MKAKIVLPVLLIFTLFFIASGAVAYQMVSLNKLKVSTDITPISDELRSLSTLANDNPKSKINVPEIKKQDDLGTKQPPSASKPDTSTPVSAPDTTIQNDYLRGEYQSQKDAYKI